jgi:hypothetical protein
MGGADESDTADFSLRCALGQDDMRFKQETGNTKARGTKNDNIE